MKKLLLIPFAVWPAVAWSAHHEEGHQAAINWTELGLQSVTFAIFVGGLIYFARKPIAAFFLARHNAVKTAVTEAQKAVEEANAQAKAYAQKMADLDKEMADLKATFKGQAEQEKARLLQDAETAAKKVRFEAEQAIAAELQKAQDQLRKDAADIAVKMAQDILSREIKADDHQRLVDDFMKTLTHKANQKAA